jgi:hypothetical protein
MKVDIIVRWDERDNGIYSKTDYADAYDDRVLT